MTQATAPTSLSIFVTGAAGAGLEVVRQLAARGHQVAATANSLDSANAVREAGGLPVYSDHIRSSEVASALKMISADVVVNLASQSLNMLPVQNQDWNHHADLLRQGTEALVGAAQSSDVKFIVHTSYAFLYGNVHGEWVDEKASVAADDPFFAAAVKAEQTVLNSKVPGCVLRAGYIYGPENEGLAALRDILRAGRGLMLGDEHAYANWIHSSDLAAAVIQAVERQPAGEIFNIVDDQPAALVTFAGQFSTAYGVSKPAARRIPPMVAGVLMNKTLMALLEGSARARNDKARNELGWTPRYAGQQQGIEQTLLVWRAHEMSQG